MADRLRKAQFAELRKMIWRSANDRRATFDRFYGMRSNGDNT